MGVIKIDTSGANVLSIVYSAEFCMRPFATTINPHDAKNLLRFEKLRHKQWRFGQLGLMSSLIASNLSPEEVVPKDNVLLMRKFRALWGQMSDINHANEMHRRILLQLLAWAYAIYEHLRHDIRRHSILSQLSFAWGGKRQLCVHICTSSDLMKLNSHTNSPRDCKQ